MCVGACVGVGALAAWILTGAAGQAFCLCPAYKRICASGIVDHVERMASSAAATERYIDYLALSFIRLNVAVLD